MRTINFRRALHGALVLLEWYLSGKLHKYRFVEVPGPVTVTISEVK